MILVWIRFWWIIQDILPRVKILIETCNLLVLKWIVVISYQTFQAWKDVFLVANDIFIFIRKFHIKVRGENDFWETGTNGRAMETRNIHIITSFPQVIQYLDKKTFS